MFREVTSFFSRCCRPTPSAQNFFDDLALMFYAGASLPAPLWRELVALGKRSPAGTFR